MTRLAGKATWAAMCEAVKKFGPITPENKAEVTRYVQRRVQELRGGQQPMAFDPKQAQTGERDE